MRTEQENKELAELLYPNNKLTLEDIWKKYPRRNLIEGQEITRIAPSPTGYFHMGGVFQSLINYLIAKKSGGKYYLRIEDTDTKRELQGAGEIAYKVLCEYGLMPDEGYEDENNECGSYGPYKQSERLDIYHAFAKQIVENGRAFPCFCEKSESKEDVLKRREEELEDSSDIAGKDPCRDLSLEQIKKNLSDGKKWALRLYSLGNGEKTFKFKDKIKGEREIYENDKDIVIVKSDGIPPYAFAHAVDDTLMGTTTVVRGEEWFPSLSAHLELFKAMGLNTLKYAHTPLLCKMGETGKRKLSKRKDPEADARFLIVEGYPVLGVIDYLMNLLNSDYEQWRAQNIKASYMDFNFTLSKIGSNSPMFDMIKLADVCKNHIAYLSAKEVYEEAFAWAKEYDVEFAKILENDDNYAQKVLNIDREKPRPRKDIAKWKDIPELFFYMFNELFWARAREYAFPDNISKQDVKNVLLDYATNLKDYATNEEWFASVKEVAGRNGFATDMKEYKANPEAYKGSVADVSAIIRVAITTKAQTPDLFEIISLLGTEEIKKRLIFLIKD